MAPLAPLAPSALRDALHSDYSVAYVASPLVPTLRDALHSRYLVASEFELVLLLREAMVAQRFLRVSPK